jgi:hypothetical protein
MTTIDDGPEEITVDERTITVLTGLYDRDGKLTPEQVVAEAADSSSPLHDKFEWDDAVAGHLYRLEQARGLIRKVQVVVEQTQVRAFVHLRSAGSYTPIRDAMSNVDTRAEVLAAFQRDAERFEARWANLGVVAEVYRAWVARQAAAAKRRSRRSS